jgi:signal peptidase I
MRYLLMIGMMAISIPFWLPSSLGGEISYHFVVSNSMKGTLDTGAFVILRPSHSYQIGDVVGYREGLPNGKTATIIHRIVDRLPDGRYVLKGDAATGRDAVEERAITGRLVMAVPAMGFLPGAVRHAPVLFGLLVGVWLLIGQVDKIRWDKLAPGGSLFLPALLVVALTLPFAPDGLAGLLSRGPALLLPLALVGVSRLIEVHTSMGGLRRLSAGSYGMAIALSVSTVPAVVGPIKLGLGL